MGVAPEALEEWVYSSRGFFLRLSKEFYHVRRAHECEFGSLGLSLVQEEPPSLRTEREGNQRFAYLL